jgi:hypothetical protein
LRDKVLEEKGESLAELGILAKRAIEPILISPECVEAPERNCLASLIDPDEWP